MSLKTSTIGEGWLSLLRWLPPPKLSKVGLFRGSHDRRPTTTRPLDPFLLRLCQRVIVEDVFIITGDDPRCRSTMHGGGWLPELLGPRHGHRRVHARVGSILVTLAWLETSPSARSHRSAPPRLDLTDVWVPLDPRARLSVSLCWPKVKEWGARSSLSQVDFGF
jgi:hypothetical protein